MEVKFTEAISPRSSRTTLGRVVIGPPSSCQDTGSLPTVSFHMCCNRAYLTEESYKKHREEKEDHGSPVDFSTLPRTDPFEKMGKAIHDLSSMEFWMCRKGATGIEFDRDMPELEPMEGAEIQENLTLNGSNFKKVGDCYVTCSICNLRLHKATKRRHMERCHVVDGKFKCQFCPCTFLLDIGRKSHESRMHNVNGVTVLKKSIIQRAKRQLIPKLIPLSQMQKLKRTRTCPYCGKYISNLLNLRDHINVHTGARPYKCGKCGFKFSHRSNLKRHEKRSHNSMSKQYFCKICSCSFSSHNMLVRHKTSVHSNKHSSMQMASPKLKPVQDLVEDENSGDSNDVQLPSLIPQHPAQNSNGMYECPNCGKELTTPQTWRGHMRIHLNLKPYKCAYCGIFFRLHSTRAHHIRKCHSNGTHQCRACSCRLTDKQALLLHVQRYHSGRKTNKMKKIQSIYFKQKDSPKEDTMSTNMDVVTESYFKCQLCGKFFLTFEDFKQHEEMHKNPPFRHCRFCLAKFDATGNMKAHEKRAHHLNGSYKCSFCCVRYVGSAPLFNHLVKVHGLHRNEWNFKQKQIKPNARERILMEAFKRDTGGSSDQFKLASIETDSIQNHQSNGPATEMDSSSVSMPDSKKRVECFICHVKVASLDVLKLHLQRSHFNDGHFKCDKCPCQFQNDRGLLLHQTLYHGHIGRNKLRRLAAEMNAGAISANSTKPALNGLQAKLGSQFSYKGLRFLCTICNKSFATKRFLEYHFNAHKYGNTFQCSMCPMKFSMPSSLRNHKKNCHLHHGQFKCSKCPCKFLSPNGLQNHQNFFHNKNPENEASEIASDSQTDPLQLEWTSNENGNMPDSFTIPESATAKYQCTICRKILSSKGSLESHNRLHTRGDGELKYECDICHLKFLHPDSIVNHKKRCHFHNGQFKCTECCCKFLTDGALQNHRGRYHGFLSARRRRRKDTFQCTFCDKILSRSQFTSHMAMHSRAEAETGTENSYGDYQCNLCPCKFLTAGGVEAHLRRFHGQSVDAAKIESDRQRFQETIVNQAQPQPVTRMSEGKVCDQCNLTIGGNTKLQQHIQMSHDPNAQFKCSYCTCRYHTFKGLARHKHYYHSDKLGSKGKNGKITVPQFTLSRPIQIKPPANSVVSTVVMAQKVLKNTIKRNMKVHKCRYCGLTFNRTNSLNMHLQKAHTGGTHSCMECSCTFHSAQGLAKHIVHKHSNKNPPIPVEVETEEPSKTVETSASASSSSISKIPKRTCHLCGLHFTSWAFNLQEHIKSAHSNGLYKCNRCTCSFHTAFGLRKHYRKHRDPAQATAQTVASSSMKKGIVSSFQLGQTSSRSLSFKFQCKLCGIRFTQKNNLENHQKRAHTNGNFKCDQCQCSYENQNGLTAHKRFHHNQGEKFNVGAVQGKSPKKGANAAAVQTELYPSVPPRGPSLAKNYKFHCDLCGLKFTSSHYLKRHQNTAHFPEGYKCDECNCTFANVIQRAAHKRVYHNVKFNGFGHGSSLPKPLSGGNVVVAASNGPSHTQPTRKRINQHKCDQCEGTFQSRLGLLKHTRKAHSGGHLKCHLCPCSFHSLGSLSAHRKIYHNSAKLEVDNDSGITSTSHTPSTSRSRTPDSNLSVRSRVTISTSSTEQAFEREEKYVEEHKCSFCPKSFGSKRKLELHTLSHTRPEVCVQCNGRFRTKDEVSRHVLTNHGDGKFQCHVCSCRFVTALGLKQHTTYVHRKQLSSAWRDTGNIENLSSDFVIEQENYYEDNEPFLRVDSTYTQQQQEEDNVEDSEPIVQGILDTNYSNSSHMNRNFESQHHAENEEEEANYDDSEPIIQGIMDYEDGSQSRPEFQSLSAPNPPESVNKVVLVAKKRTFSPKTRPMKCPECGQVCFGPENLREHVESHSHEDQVEPEADESNDSGVERAESSWKCAQCKFDFASNDELDEHLEMEHAEGGLYRCVYCPCTMKTEVDLRSHFVKFHNNNS